MAIWPRKYRRWGRFSVRGGLERLQRGLEFLFLLCWWESLRICQCCANVQLLRHIQPCQQRGGRANTRVPRGWVLRVAVVVFLFCAPRNDCVSLRGHRTSWSDGRTTLPLRSAWLGSACLPDVVRSLGRKRIGWRASASPRWGHYRGYCRSGGMMSNDLRGC